MHLVIDDIKLMIYVIFAVLQEAAVGPNGTI